MSIKRCIAFVLLALFIYGGIYITVYGLNGYVMYSGTERGFYSRKEDLADGLNIKGSVETVIKQLGSEDITQKVLGIPLKQARRYYFVLPLGCAEDGEVQQYCVIAADNPADVEALRSLMKGAPVPLDPNAPRFEFRGLVMSSTLDVQKSLTEYLRDVYATDFDIYYALVNVNKYIVPYTIYVKSANDDSYPLVITIGLIVTLAAAVLAILLAVNTYRKAHRFD